MTVKLRNGEKITATEETFVSLWLIFREASKRYEENGYNGLAKEAYANCQAIDDALDRKRYFNK